ncbi:MAG TPA: AAA family ATPase [Nitrospiraceae bacterium]
MKQTAINMKGLEGFTSVIEADDKLAMAVYGLQGSGKTKLAITAPDPIGFVALDRKARKTVERISKELGKTVFMPKEDFIRVGNPMELATMKVEQAKIVYRRHVDSIKMACFKLYKHPQVRTIVLDTGSQLWEDMLFAHFGRNDRIMPRDRGAVNQEMIDLLNALSGKHLIITHKAKEVWRNDKPTGRFEIAGFPHIGYHVNSMIELKCDSKKEEGDDGRFTLDMILCQDNPAIQGPGGKNLLSDDMISFQNLAQLIYPDADPEEFE